MSANQPKEREHVRRSTAVVILVLALVGFVLFWQFVLEGSINRPTPEQIVTETLRLGLSDPDGFEVIESIPGEIHTARGAKAAVVRLRYRARDDRSQLRTFDKAFIVIGDGVRSATDWTPEVEATIANLLEQAAKK